ncbi:hypothetical protein MHU86_3711 [Fragilaria crotonensis]|nr:hypothetical protein MHU86_3711 [Fragilaria crotonensis]
MSLLGSIPLNEFIKVNNQEMKHREELVKQDDLDKPQSTTNVLSYVFDSFLAFEGNEELHQQRPPKPLRMVSEDNLLLPAMDMFLVNALLNLNNIPIVQRGRSRYDNHAQMAPGSCRMHQACKVSSLGSRRRGKCLNIKHQMEFILIDACDV